MPSANHPPGWVCAACHAGHHYNCHSQVCRCACQPAPLRTRINFLRADGVRTWPHHAVWVPPEAS